MLSVYAVIKMAVVRGRVARGQARVEHFQLVIPLTKCIEALWDIHHRRALVFKVQHCIPQDSDLHYEAHATTVFASRVRSCACNFLPRLPK